MKNGWKKTSRDSLINETDNLVQVSPPVHDCCYEESQHEVERNVGESTVAVLHYSFESSGET